MGLNAQTTVPAFTAGQVLTAAQQNNINTGIPVFADTTARDAAFGGLGEKVLAEGQYAFLEDTNATQFYDGAAWQTVGGGLTYITQATPSAVNSVSINNCFSSTYDSYFVTMTTSAYVGGDTTITMRLRASGTDANTNYDTQRTAAYSTTIITDSNPNGTDEWYLGFNNSTNPTSYVVSFQVFNPFLAASSRYLGNSFIKEAAGPPNVLSFGGYHSTASSYDGFTILASGTSFTGTIRVYGYQNS